MCHDCCHLHIFVCIAPALLSLPHLYSPSSSSTISPYYSSLFLLRSHFSSLTSLFAFFTSLHSLLPATHSPPSLPPAPQFYLPPSLHPRLAAPRILSVFLLFCYSHLPLTVYAPTTATIPS